MTGPLRPQVWNPVARYPQTDDEEWRTARQLSSTTSSPDQLRATIARVLATRNNAPTSAPAPAAKQQAPQQQMAPGQTTPQGSPVGDRKTSPEQLAQMVAVLSRRKTAPTRSGKPARKSLKGRKPV